MRSAETLWLEAYDCVTPAFTASIDELCRRRIHGKRNQNFLASRSRHVAILLLNFYLNQDKPIPVHSAKMRYQKGKVEYTKGFRHEHMMFAKNLLLNEGYLEEVSKANYKHKTATFKATEKLVRALRDVVPIEAITEAPRDKKSLVVLMKKKPEKSLFDLDSTKGIIKIKESSDVKQTRELLIRYNELIRSTSIQIKGQEPIQRLKGNQLYQIYTSLDGTNEATLHGRFYGHWVQQENQITRAKILINGEPTVEPDFRSMHALLLYINSGEDYRQYSGTDANGQHDIYSGFAFNGLEGTPAQMRNLAKQLLLKAMNARSIRGAIVSTWADINAELELIRDAIENGSLCEAEFRREELIYPQYSNNILRPKSQKRGYPLLKNAMKEVLNRHTPLKPYLEKQKILGNELGLTLMFWDSRVATKVLQYFTDKGEPIIPIHESFLCRMQVSEEMVKVMFRALQEVVDGHIRKGCVLPYKPEDIIRIKPYQDTL